MPENHSSANETAESSSSNNNLQTKNFVHLMLTNFSKMWRTTTEQIDQILEDIGAYVLLDSIARHLARHPYLALGVSAGILSVALPFIIFMVFAISTVILSFTGFIIVEGTLITIASVLLFGFLGVVLLVSLFFGIVILAGYFGFIHVYDMLRPPPIVKPIKQNILPKSNVQDSNKMNNGTYEHQLNGSYVK